MRCRSCGSTLDRPGDHCLVCGASPTDAVVLVIGEERADLTMMDEATVLGETAITTRTEHEDPTREVQRRNYIARIVAEIRRKRPDALYVTGDRDLVRRLRRRIKLDLYRITDEDPVQAYQDRVGDAPLDVVDRAPADKLGGSHSTLIGDRRGRSAVHLVAEHPHVKKIIPGPIDASGTGSRTGFRVKVTRPDASGNLRLLLRDGSSVQEVRLVTTARNLDEGERIATQLNEELAESGDFG